MIKFKTSKNNLKIISSSILTTSIMMSTIAGCSRDNNNTDFTETFVTDTSISSVIPASSDSDMITSNVEESKFTLNTDSPSLYQFPWENDENIAFDNYVQQRFNRPLAGYVVSFGFTEELSIAYTDFVNERFNTNYDSIPFSKANYFYTYISVDEKHGTFREYDYFSINFLNDEKIIKGAFNNKFIYSYFVANGLTFGERVSLEDLKKLVGDDIYTLDMFDYFINNPTMGNYDSTYKYSNEEAAGMLQKYNGSLSELFDDEVIKERDLLAHPDVYEVYNEHLKKKFGENAPQFGQVITKEQYIAMFGEEPLDLSYIDGAILKGNTQVKGDARVRYGDSIDEYTMSYLPGYEYYTEEVESQGRSR